MGGNQSTSESKEPIAELSADYQELDLSTFKLNIVKTNTSSELTIGNRRMIILDGLDKKFEFTEESGNVHRIHHVMFGSDDEKKEAILVLLNMMNSLKFFQMQNKAGKSFNTSGSDAGTTITLQNGKKRVEVKMTERTALKNKAHEPNFKQIEEQAERWISSQISKKSQFRSVTVTFSAALIKYFLDELDSGLQLMYTLPNTRVNLKTCILTSSTNIAETKVENLTLPNCEVILSVGKYSMVSFGDDSGKLTAPQAVNLTGVSSFSLDISSDKKSLVVNL
ncbi:predicted protein [Naegleria gruberi]|uniref:Predicted protein n=1 Tax=Naegleria gruberi TaxID=5762 RepID=D2VHH4_NAEGR|nr:uncharacterized protein NAEGRDRAFT_49582 [Naegleria gruberi]EFC43588.1 predicted protein [Naegleria gruberi]|eukprot:XP_002676332.1 predicted protein [Naegleria gruberi strain NEG-M]